MQWTSDAPTEAGWWLIFKRFALMMSMRLRGIVCRFQYGDMQVTVRRDGWIVMADGVSGDAIPISLVSQELADRIERELVLMYGK